MAGPNNTRRRLLTLAAAAPLAGAPAAAGTARSALSPEYQAQRAIVVELAAEAERLSHYEDRVEETPERVIWEAAIDRHSEAVDELVQIPVSTAAEVADKFTQILRRQCENDQQVGRWGIDLDGEEALALWRDIKRVAEQEAAR